VRPPFFVANYVWAICDDVGAAICRPLSVERGELRVGATLRGRPKLPLIRVLPLAKPTFPQGGRLVGAAICRPKL